ncbi:pheromone A receptor-domain-containing protein [Myxozyma melibiosi]|uniref:Pheromone A receptor-domain-containing protein n=1 Tax=Myxozyma melibiosi TaxID=54550 RepID=A0ABR1FDK3_9ASCO
MIYVPLFVTSLISLMMCVAPLFWHISQQNTAVLFLIGWTVLGNLCVFMNSIPWGNPDVTTYWDGRVFCDLLTRLQLMASMGTTASLTTISRNLSRIMSGQTSLAPTPSEKRYELCIQLFYSLFLPAVQLPLYYIYQYNRYFVLQYTGCSSSADASYVDLLLSILWSPILLLTATYYSVVTLFYYVKRRREISSVLRTSYSGFTTARFARLLFFSLSIIIVALPLSLYVLALNLNNGIRGFSWSFNHAPEIRDMIVILPYDKPRFEFYLYPILAFFLFAYFGLGADALNMYRRFLSRAGLGKLFPNSQWLNRGTVSTSGTYVSQGSVTDSSNAKNSNNVTMTTSTLYGGTNNEVSHYDWSSPFNDDLDVDLEKHAASDVAIVAGERFQSVSESTESDDISFSNAAGYPEEGVVRVKYEVRVEK